MTDYGCIYLITNLANGKKYVGQTRYPEPSKRWKKHIASAKRGLQYALHGAIRKYGEEGFKVDLLCNCLHSQLGHMEAYYAEQYCSYIWDQERGYNMVWCGENFRLGMTHTEEVREKLRQFNLGRKASAETRAKMSRSQTGLKRSPEGCEHIRIGKRNNPISLEGIQSIIAHKTGRKMSQTARDNMRKSRADNKNSQRVSDPNSKTYPCTYEGCTKVLSKKGSLDLHLRTHTGEKPYACNQCAKTFACGSNLDTHMITHTDERAFICTYCNKGMKYMSTLNRHIAKFHSPAATVIV